MASGEEVRANQLIIDIDKAMRSERDSDRCEAIISCSRIFDEFPFSSIVNAIFVRLGDAFRSGTNIMRVYIVKEVRQNRQHLSKLTNVSEFLRPVLAVMHSNDYIARALTLYLLSSVSLTINAKHEVHHFIREALLDSQHETELLAAIEAATTFTGLSAQFAQSISEDLVALITTPVSAERNKVHASNGTGDNSQSCRLSESTTCKVLDVFPVMYRYQCKPRQVHNALLHIYEQSSSADVRLKLLSTMTQLATNTLVLVPEQINFLLKLLYRIDQVKPVSLENGQRKHIEAQVRQICLSCGHLLTPEHVERINTYVHGRLSIMEKLGKYDDDAASTIKLYQSLCRPGALSATQSNIPPTFLKPVELGSANSTVIVPAVIECQFCLLRSDELRSVIGPLVMQTIQRYLEFSVAAQTNIPDLRDTLLARLSRFQQKMFHMVLRGSHATMRTDFVAAVVHSLEILLSKAEKPHLRAMLEQRARFAFQLSQFNELRALYAVVKSDNALSKSDERRNRSAPPNDSKVVHIVCSYAENPHCRFEILAILSALVFNVFQQSRQMNVLDSYVAALRTQQEADTISMRQLTQIAQLSTTFGCFSFAQNLLAGIIKSACDTQDESTFWQIIDAVGEAEVLIQRTVSSSATADENQSKMDVDDDSSSNEHWQSTAFTIQAALQKALELTGGIEYYLNTLKAFSMIPFQSLYLRARYAVIHAMRFAIQALLGPVRVHGGKIFNRMLFVECSKQLREAESVCEQLIVQGFDTETALLQLVAVVKRNILQFANCYDYLVETDFSLAPGAASPTPPSLTSATNAQVPCESAGCYSAQHSAHATLHVLLQKVLSPASTAAGDLSVTEIIEQKRHQLYQAICLFLSIPHVLPARFYRRRQQTSVRLNVHPPPDRPSIAVSESYLTLKIEGIVETTVLPPQMPFDDVFVDDDDDDVEADDVDEKLDVDKENNGSVVGDSNKYGKDSKSKKPLRSAKAVLIRVECRLVREHQHHAPKSVREQLLNQQSDTKSNSSSRSPEVKEILSPLKAGGFFAEEMLVNVKATGDHRITVSVSLRESSAGREDDANEDAWHFDKEVVILVKSVSS